MRGVEKRIVMDDINLFRAILMRRYGAHPTALHPLRPAYGGVYRVTHGGQSDSDWVLRAYRDADPAALDAYVSTLIFLERQGYPAPRLVHAVEGQPVIAEHGWHILVTTYVEGDVTDYQPPSLRLLGAALGRLHRLNTRDATMASPPVPVSWRLPTLEGPAILERLRAHQSRVPPALGAQYEAFTTALEELPSCTGLPRALLHTDPYPGNAIRTSAEHVALLDWDGAGLGPAIIDVGYLLITCDKGLPKDPRPHPDPGRIAALVQGYAHERPPTATELDALADGMRSWPATRGARAFVDALTDPARTVAWRSWRGRYEAVEEVAALARSYFAPLHTSAS